MEILGTLIPFLLIVLIWWRVLRKSMRKKDPLWAYTVVDTETTGLYPPEDRIVEIAAARVRNGAIVKSMCFMVDPGRKMNPEATAVNGISDDMLRGKPSFAQVKSRLLEFIGDDIIVGHNLPFDIEFLEHEIGHRMFNRKVDTLRIARKLYRMKSYSLASLSRSLGLAESQEHRALSDVELTRDLMEHMKRDAREAGTSLPQLIG